MSKKISILVSLEGQDSGLKRAIDSAERSLGDLSTTAKTVANKTAADMAVVRAGMASFGEQVQRAKTQLLAFVTINWAAGKAQQIVELADAWNLMAARLKLATAGQREFTTAQSALFDIAQRIGVPIQETATLYGKLQQAVRMLGGEQQQALAITETISQALRISGASASEAQSALLQFGQALASGVLRGEEFNSVVENSPRLAQALADGLNVPIGRLRKMAEEGQLTADVVVNALLGQKDKLASEYAQLPQTVGQAFERLRNAFGRWISRLDESTGMSKKLAGAMSALADHLDTVMQWLTRIAEVGLAVLVYRLIPALITAWQTAGAAGVAAASATSAAWAVANQSVSAAIAKVGLLRTAFLAIGSFLAGWEIGGWLSEKFEIVRKAGISMVEMLIKGIEQLQYRWEVFKAVFTSDTIEQATERHEARLAQMNQIFGQMYLDATKGADAAKGAMNSAASAAEEIARRLEAVRQGTQEAVARGVQALDTALEKLKSSLGQVEQAVTKASQTAHDATSKMAAAYKMASTVLEAELQRQTDAVKERYQQEQAQLATSAQTQEAQITRSTQLLGDALTQQTALRSQATDYALQLIDGEAQARMEAARHQDQTDQARSSNVQRIENEMLAAKRLGLAQALAEYRQHIDALNAEANRHLLAVERIEEEKRRLAMGTDERIREIRRAGLSDYEANEDRIRQIAEYQSKARQALAEGEFDQAKQLAQKAMDIAAQVASHQTSEARRAQDARTQSEQAASQAAQLEAQARTAWDKQEYAQSEALMRQAAALRSELAQKTRDADAQIALGKDGVNQAIQRIRDSEEILKNSLDGESAAHRKAAQSALTAREQIRQTLEQTAAEIDQITARIGEGLQITLDADTRRFKQAIAELDNALADKRYLLKIQADLQEAEKKLQQYEQLLKEGKTLPVDADVTRARNALERLKLFADQSAQLDLKVASDKAQAAITNVEGMIKALDRIQTESRHQISTNADAARAQVMSLQGANTSSTHTIYVQRVQANASGGLIAGVRGFASGGAVSQAFPRMTGGTVPGSGNQDTVPRTLEAGAFVLRQAAVRKYGSSVLSRLAHGIARFADGGQVASTTVKKNRDVAKAQKTMELGLASINSGNWGGPIANQATRSHWSRLWNLDKPVLEQLLHLQTLTTRQRSALDEISKRWQWAMQSSKEDLERKLLDEMEQRKGEFYAGGGIARSDSVPAMLTPGEYVVNKNAVARYGAGLFDAINNLSVPAQAFAGRVLAGVQGFASGGLVEPIRSGLTRPVLPTDGGALRTVRVELSSGQQKVNASVDVRDEARLLQLLATARTRAS